MKSARGPVLAALALVLPLVGCGALIPAHYRIAVARKDMQKGNWRGAAVELRTVVRAHPKNAEAWLLLTRVSLDADDPTDAPADLKHALASGAKGPGVDELRIRTWLETGQPKAVLEAIAQHTVSLGDPEQSIAVARAYLALDQPDKALTIVRRLLAAHPRLTKARVAMAETLAREGQLDNALQELDKAMELDPKSPDPTLLKGQILASRGQFAAAESALSVSLRHMPASEPVAHRLIALATLTESRLTQGEIKAATQTAAALTHLAPGAPVTQVLDARIKLLHGDVGDAIDELERVVTNVPTYVEARLLLGGALINRGDLQQAQDQLERVIQQTPDNVEARKLLATVQLKLNEPGQALGVLTPALSTEAADPQTLSLLGVLAKRVGDSQAVVEALERSEKAHPDNKILRQNLAQAYLASGQPAKALALLDKTADDTDPRRDGLLIAALTAVRGPEAAGVQVDKLVAAHPRDIPILTLAADYFASQGILDRARTLLDEAIKLDPRDVGAVVGLAHVEQAAGDSSSAQQTLQTGLASDPKALAIRLELSNLLVSERHFSQAVKLLQVSGHAQADPNVQFALARVYLAKGDLEQANAVLDRVIAAHSGEATLVENAGVLLLQARQYDAALARFARATQLAPNNATYWLNTARAQLALNQPLAARDSLGKASQLHHNWLPVIATLSLMDLREHKAQAALDRANALLSSVPHDSGALALKGYVEAATGNLNAATAAYAEAQREQPSPTLAVKLFQLQLAMHKAQPQKPLESWLARQPEDWRVRDILGSYYLSTHQLKNAAAAFQADLKISPNDVVALNNLAWIEDKLGKAQAETLAERAHQLAPQSPNVDDTLGWILARKRDTARALPLLEQASKLSPKSPDVQYHYAYVLAQDGKRGAARQILTKLLAAPSQFDSRSEAERLLAATRT